MAAVFHTSLLHVDARINADGRFVQLNDNQSHDEEGAELVCNRTGSFLTLPAHDALCDRQQIEFNILSSLTPAECRTMHPQAQARMLLCSSGGNCSQIILTSSTAIDLDLVVEQVVINAGQGCRVQIGDVLVHQMPSTLLCNCPIKCPILLEDRSPSAPSTAWDATTESSSGRVRNIRGFWTYFMLRIFASMALGTSFSMLDATAICMVKNYGGVSGFM